MVTISVQAQSSHSLYVGGSTILSPPNPPSGCTVNQTAWGCDNAYVDVKSYGTGASVRVTGYFSGTATVICSYSYYKYVYGRPITGRSEAHYYIKCIPVSLRLDKDKANMNVGETLNLSYSFSPNISPKPSVSWSTSNSNVATVNSYGDVYAVGGGTTTITAQGGGGTAQCVITVKKVDIPAESITLPENKTISIGKGIQLSAQVKPANFNGTLKWSSSNKDIATVSSSGYVSALKKGTTTITAEAANGKKGTCKITVPALSKEEAEELNRPIINRTWSNIKNFVNYLKNAYNL